MNQKNKDLIFDFRLIFALDWFDSEEEEQEEEEEDQSFCDSARQEKNMKSKHHQSKVDRARVQVTLVTMAIPPSKNSLFNGTFKSSKREIKQHLITGNNTKWSGILNNRKVLTHVLSKLMNCHQQ